MTGSLHSVLKDSRGVAAIEFCLTLPVLLLLTLGAYDVSRMVTQRLEYQQAVAEAAGLVLANPPQGSNYSWITGALTKATGLPVSNFTVSRETRCDGTVVTTSACANASAEVSRYFTITVRASYVPMWSHFGMNRAVNMTVTRTIRYQ